MVKKVTNLANMHEQMQFQALKLAMIREAMQISVKDNKQVFMLIHDEQTGNLVQYNSGDHKFTSHELADLMKKNSPQKRIAKKKARRTLRVTPNIS